MSSVLAVARSTFREAVRDRVLFLVVAFGIAVLALSRLLSPIALGEGSRITVDLGLAALGLLGVFIVALVGTNLVHKEIDRRTIYMVLSRPVSRASYLVGKWLGLTVTMGVAVSAMGLVLMGVGWLTRGAVIVPPIAQAVFLVICGNAVLASLAVLFSSLSTPVLSTLYTLGLYASGYWTADVREFAGQLGGFPAAMLRSVSYALPNLELFNLRSQVAHSTGADGLHLALALAYAAAYATAALALAVVAFERRELK